MIIFYKSKEKNIYIFFLVNFLFCFQKFRFKLRSKIISFIRRFLEDEKQFIEVFFVFFYFFIF